MKGCKDGKGDGSNHRGGTGGGSGAIGVETGALFPRLHVKETKRVGPRAPPRNKMALYEQFTFPSHRFGPPPSVPLPTPGRSSGSTPYSPHVLPTGEKMALYEQFTFPSHRFAPPSGSLPSSGLPSGSSSTVLQSSSHDGSRYFCPPSYGNMGMPYMAMNVPHHVGQPFVNGSGSSTIVDGDSEMQRSQSIPATDSGCPSSREVGHASPRHSNANARSSASKKGRANDDCTVPIYTAPKASTGFPKVYTEGSDWFSRGPWQSGVDLTKAYQSIPVSYDYQVESSGPTSQRGECREDSVTDVTGEHRGTEVSAKIIYSERGVAQEIDLPEGLCGGAHKEKQITQIRSRYSQHTDFREYGADQSHRRKNKQYFDDTSEAEGVRSCGTGNGECLTVLEDDEDLGLKHRKASSKAKPMKDSEVTNSPHDHTQVVNQGLGKKQRRVESDRETYRKQSCSTECRSNTAGSSDDNVENSGDGEVSEHTQPTLWSDSEESGATMVEAASSHKITPKDLINAVGQQGFWTARKLLQRQQMIFSSQVFELHRLIKVQQLLAAPDYGGDEDDQAAPLSQDECPPEKGQAKKTTPEKQCSGHGGDDYEKNKRAMGQQPDSTCQSSTSKRVSVQPSNPDPQCSVDNAAPAPVLPSAATSGTLGAWGYPPFVKPGGSGWYGSMPAVNSPYMYQPYPGSFPQPAMHNMGAFNGSYRPVMCAPTPMDVSAMSSYGMPGYEARPDLMQDMYRYNTMQQQWQAAMYCNSVAQDPSASWYSLPPMPYMDPTQRMSSRWYEEMASSHPAAHPGFHRPTHQSSNPLLPTAQPMVYPMHPQWTEAALSQQQGREGERFRAQASWPMSGGSCQSSDQGSLRPVVSSAQESAASGSQVAEGGWGKTWQGSEGKSPQDSDGQPAEVPSAPQCSIGDAQESRSLKRNRENAVEGRSSRDPERQKSSAEENNPASGRRDALPLFPLVPVSNGGEKLKSSHSFPGVIKVVPRAMVATAESAAEILLSIQKQRQQ